MRYLVPQFISRQVKIVGPLTFKQFMFLGPAAGICFILYFLFKNFYLFLLISAFVMAIGFALAFYRYHKVPLPDLIAKFVGYLFKGHIFLWKKKAIVPKAYQIPKYEPQQKEKPKRITTRQRGQLEELSTKVETKS